MRFDVRAVPFSRYGSTLALSWSPAWRVGPEREGLTLRALHGGPKWGDVFRISLRRKGRELSCEASGSAVELRLRARGGEASLVFGAPDTLLLKATGVEVRFEAVPAIFDGAHALPSGEWLTVHFAASTRFRLAARRGAVRCDAPWRQKNAARIVVDFVPDHAGRAEGEIRELPDPSLHSLRRMAFDAGKKAADADWKRWRKRLLGPRPVPKADELAAYVLWSSAVGPRGLLRRPALFMSKNKMSNVWSWDHCFNALALCRTHPALAWDQWMLFFDHQTPEGAMPDCLGDSVACWDFAKPPVHGWALQKMLDLGFPLSRAQAAQAYGALEKWTGWWLTQRDLDRDGRPEYYHGNDSGWDNATLFAGGLPVESPDLVAFLLLQMRTLSGLARRLGKGEAARTWKQRSDSLLAILLKQYWTGDRFRAFGPLDRPIDESRSLMLYLPLALGPLLPLPVRIALLRRLRSSGLLTRHGLATEPPGTALYEADGYWRGPIWAPPTYLISDGLWNMGEKPLAARLARGFRSLCRRSGFAENFDAVSGAGLRDPAYTWTASVYLLLQDYCHA